MVRLPSPMQHTALENPLAVMDGGACMQMPMQTRDKYFGATRDGSFEAQTARNICARCPVLERCAAVAVELPGRHQFVGVMAGLTRSQITALRAWRAYDAGLREKPKGRRPAVPVAWAASPAEADAAHARKLADLSFEEQVYLVFRDIRSGRYPKLNDAIHEIARIHEQVVQG